MAEKKFPQIMYPIFKGDDGRFYLQDPPCAERIKNFTLMSDARYNELLADGNLIILNPKKKARIATVGMKQIYCLRMSEKKLTFASKKVFDELLQESKKS